MWGRPSLERCLGVMWAREVSGSHVSSRGVCQLKMCHVSSRGVMLASGGVIGLSVIASHWIFWSQPREVCQPLEVKCQPREAMSASRGATSASRGAMSASRGVMSASRGVMSASGVVMSASRGVMSVSRGAMSASRCASQPNSFPACRSVCLQWVLCSWNKIVDWKRSRLHIIPVLINVN